MLFSNIISISYCHTVSRFQNSESIKECLANILQLLHRVAIHGERFVNLSLLTRAIFPRSVYNILENQAHKIF